MKINDRSWKSYKKKYKNQLDTRDSKTKSVYDSIYQLSQYHPNTLQAAHLLKNDNDSMYDDSIDYYKKADNLNLLEDCIRLYLLSLSNEKINDKIEIITKYNNEYVPSNDFLWVAAGIFKNNEYFVLGDDRQNSCRLFGSYFSKF